MLFHAVFTLNVNLTHYLLKEKNANPHIQYKFENYKTEIKLLDAINTWKLLPENNERKKIYDIIFAFTKRIYTPEKGHPLPVRKENFHCSFKPLTNER